MPEDRSFKLLQTCRSSDTRKKKVKKRKKAPASTTPPENTEAAAFPPGTLPASPLPPQSPGQPRGRLPRLRATSKKDGQRLSGSGRRSTKHPKDSPARLTETSKTSGSGSRAPAQGLAAELGAQARESLRWEGVLDDPQAEEKRLERYRASRRQRYIAHREALAKDNQDALRQTFPKESKEKRASLPHLSTD